MWNTISMLGVKIEKFDGTAFSWVNTLYQYLDPVLYAIMAIVAAAGAIYAIVLGVNLARAEDQSKRDEAKKRLVTTLIAVAITIALVLFFTQLLPTMLSSFIKIDTVPPSQNP